jgi:DNA (cytosine-5)-methyltransferase 1
MMKLRVLDLFSGVGGFSLGLERTGGFETAAFCEYEAFPRQVLAKHWPDVPCFPDVRELKGEDVDGSIDVICGGYPCQPFSQAGQRRGQEDDRHLWPEFSRIVDELRPAWVIGENVAGHISMGLDDVLSDLERQGYACRTFVIPACAVGAPHRRDRVWTIASRRDVADAEIDERWPLKSFGPRDQRRDGTNCIQGRTENSGQSGHCGKLGTIADRPIANWELEPDVGRVANGVPLRVDRLKALGNAVVPQIPEMIGRAILQAEDEGWP